MNRDGVQRHRVRERDPHIRRVRIPRVIHEFLQGLLGGPVRLTQQGSQARVHLEIRMSGLHGYSIRPEDTLWILELHARTVNVFGKRAPRALPKYVEGPARPRVWAASKPNMN